MFGRIGIGFGRMGSSYPWQRYLPEAVALFDARPNPTPTDEKIAVNKLIGTLINIGVWSGLDRLFLLNATDAANSLLDAIHPTGPQAVAVNAPTHTTRMGWQGNGVDSRLRTQFTPSVDGVNFTQNNASLWEWCATNVQSGVSDLGSVAAVRSLINPRSVAGSLDGQLNDATSLSFAVGTSVGFSGVSRSGATEKTLWRNNAQVASSSTSSTGVPALEQWICGVNSAGFSTRQIALAAWASSLVGKEAAFYAAVQTYMQDMGTI